jgi:hypothetical protein
MSAAKHAATFRIVPRGIRIERQHAEADAALAECPRCPAEAACRAAKTLR